MKRKQISSGEEMCPTCGKRIVEDGHAGLFGSYLFQSDNCTCASFDQRLHPVADELSGKIKGLLNRDSLGSFCPACGLQSTSQGPLGSITGFFFQDTRCKCQAEVVLGGEGMAERFWKLKEAEADKVFASVTRDVLNEAGKTKTSINLMPGTVIGGIYRIVQLLGKGGMGEVYLAHNQSLAKNCALKVVPPDQVTDLSWQRFQNEAKTIAGLDHINLVKVTDLGLHEGCLPYYAMEYIDGESLMDRLKSQGTLPLKAVLEIFIQVCDGLNHAHKRGVVHRDLKPGNIMIVRSPGDRLAVKVLDFGLVKLTQKDRTQQSLTKVGEVFGTPFYMSPEQCLGSKVDSRSDIYSLGCTMFEALTGRVPFMGRSAIETITAHQSAEPPSLESIVGPNVFPVSLEVVMVKLLRKLPSERYQTLLELRGDLEKVVRGDDVEPYYVSRIRRGLERHEERVVPAYGQQTFDAIAMPRFSRGAALGVSLILLTVVGFVSLPIFSTKPPPSRATISFEQPLANPAVKERETNLEAGAAPPQSLNDTAPFSSIEVEAGQKWRVFHFPEDVMIGKIRAWKGQAIKAVGTVKFPADERLLFSPEVGSVLYPDYLKRFRRGDVYGLKMSQYAGEYDKKGSESCLRVMTLIPGVVSLDLRNSDNLSEKTLPLLDKFDSLKVLTLGQADLDMHSFSELAIVKKLEELTLLGYYDLGPVLKKMRHSTLVKKLYFPASPVDLEGVANLSTLANLEQLAVDRFLPNDTQSTKKALEFLKKNSKLQELSVRKLTVISETIPLIRSYRNLKMLRYDQTGDAAPGAIRRRLSQEIPGLKLGPAYLDSGKLP